MSKPYLFSVIIAVIIAAISSIFLGISKFLLHFTNSIFYIGLILFIVGGFLLVVESGFFNITRYGMKKIFRSKEEKIAQMAGEEKPTISKEMIYKRHSFPSTKPLLFASLTLIIFSYAISIILTS